MSTTGRATRTRKPPPSRVSTPGSVLLASPDAHAGIRWLLFAEPAEILLAKSIAEVPAVLQRVEEAARAGLTAAGFVSYEAAPAFDPHLTALPPSELPPAWFGIYHEARETAPPDFKADFELSSWSADTGPEEYARAIRRIKDYIAAGDTYQVNYTMRLRAQLRGSGPAFFTQLHRAQHAPYSAYIDTGRHRVLSASPELFFRLEGDRITSKPMKGTAPRGLWADQDERRAADLAASPKDRAENVMIVDLVRNDIGRIAKVGSVRAPRLFDVERYDTLWQMTSTIEAQTRAGLGDVFAALFPCGSVTGAPKVRTMEIIRELEPSARGVYTGAIGFAGPGPLAQFNVAIRTVVVDAETGKAEYGVGGGVTWGSTAAGEYQECLLKARVLSETRPTFCLLETMLWEKGGFFLQQRHLARLSASARYFGFSLDEARLRRRLDALGSALGGGRHRVRLLLQRNGEVELEHAALPRAAGAKVARVALARSPIDENDPFMYHKTTHRVVYEKARAARPDVDDVVLVNSHGELTEATIANLVVDIGGRLCTPPVRCGLLAGTFRDELLARGEVEERVLTPPDLRRARAVYLVNSVRRYVTAALVE